MSRSTQFHIQILDEEGLFHDDNGPIFTPADFGGIVPQVGDLIAIPVEQDLHRDPRENPRMRTVVERYFWPMNDPGISVRICLLVRERGVRKGSSRRPRAKPGSGVRSRIDAADIPFIIQQIYKCLGLAKEATDPDIADSLRKLATVFADRAIALGADPDTIPRDTETSRSAGTS
jgi:hypothetical protein